MRFDEGYESLVYVAQSERKHALLNKKNPWDTVEKKRHLREKNVAKKVTRILRFGIPVRHT